jgi:hypothetical protein
MGFHTSASARVRQNAILLAVLASITFAGIGAFLLYGHEIKACLEPEVYKLTYQFLLVVVAGALVTFALQSAAYARNLREAERERQRETHGAVVVAYSAAKRCRRLLRARALLQPVRSWWRIDIDVGYAEYDQQMLDISDAQLKLELAIRKIKADRDLFAHSKEIRRLLTSVEAYLGDLVEEWEGARRRLGAAVSKVPLRRLPKLSDFVLPYNARSTFYIKFRKPFHRALRLFEQDIAL